MASFRCRNEEAFFPTGHRFFKIIHRSDITQGKLVIPRKFIQKYKINLQSPVLLKLPNGAVWEVELRKRGNEVLLEEGWQDFVKYYSLAYGNFLVFEYGGDCKFSVIIFDKTATEIEYSLNGVHSQDQGGELKQPDMDKIENDDTIAVFDDISSNQETRGEKPHSVLPDCGVRNLENTQRDANPHSCTSQPQETDSFSCKMGERKSWRAQRMAERERVKALQGACDFKSKNPFFKVVMQKTHVQTIYSLTVSEFFAAKYFPERRGNVNLCICDGRTWPAKYYTTKCGRRLQTKIFHGWREFAKDMRLELGDVCVFELIDAAKISISVAIFRRTDLEIKQANDKLTRRGVGGSRPARKIPISSRKRANVRRGRDYQDVIEARSIDLQENSEEYERDKVAEGIMSVTPKHPYFVHFYKDYQKYNLRMPTSFAAATELAKKPSTVIEDPEGRKWPVCITVSCKGDHVYFSSGFHDFTEANGIVSGDTIVFHFRKLGRNVIDAQIHSKGRRSINDGNQKTSKGAVKSEPLVV